MIHDVIRYDIKTSSSSRKKLDLGNIIKINQKSNHFREEMPLTNRNSESARLKLIFYNSNKCYFTRPSSSNKLCTFRNTNSIKSSKNIIMPTKTDLLRKKFIQYKM